LVLRDEPRHAQAQWGCAADPLDGFRQLARLQSASGAPWTSPGSSLPAQNGWSGSGSKQSGQVREAQVGSSQAERWPTRPEASSWTPPIKSRPSDSRTP